MNCLKFRGFRFVDMDFILVYLFLMAVVWLFDFSVALPKRARLFLLVSFYRGR